MTQKRFLKKEPLNKTKLEIVFLENRLIFIQIIIITGFSLIVGKMFLMQVVDYKEYKNKASYYQNTIEKIPAKRGEIYLIDYKEKNSDLLINETSINFNKLDKIVSNIYKYNVIVDPKSLFDFENKAQTIYYILNNKDIDKNLIRNKLAEINNVEVYTEKFLEFAFFDLYKYKEAEEEQEIFEKKKKDLEYTINTTKYKSTKTQTETKLRALVNAYKIDKETEDGIVKLKEERVKIISKLGKITDQYEIIKKNIEEADKDKIKDFFSNLYFESFKAYIKEDDSKETKETQLKNFYKNFLIFEQTETRFYSDGNIFGQITGFLVQRENEKIGQYGIEGYFDKKLKGIEGEVKGTYSARGKIIATSNREVKEAENGSNIILTIDKAIQYKVCKELEIGIKEYGAQDGSISIMNPDTGELIAMCNYPTFDPNEYNKVEDIRVYENPIISDQLEFGSIFKAITMAAGVDSKAVGPYSTYKDTGCLKRLTWTKQICNSDFRNLPNGHGQTTVIEALEKSLNLGAFYVAEKVGADKYKQYMEDFGFGKRTGIENVSEATGDLRNLEKMNSKKGGDVYLATASFGQGITVSQIQFMSAFSAIVNGGKLMQPHLVKMIINGDNTIERNDPKLIKQVISEQSSTTMKGMLASVTEKGYSKLAQVNGYYIGGKTGTAQFAENGVYKDKTMQSFIGFGPVSKPKFVIMVKLNNPKTEYASTSCTPIFSNIAKFLFDYYQIPPEKIDK